MRRCLAVPSKRRRRSSGDLDASLEEQLRSPATGAGMSVGTEPEPPPPPPLPPPSIEEEATATVVPEDGDLEGWARRGISPGVIDRSLRADTEVPEFNQLARAERLGTLSEQDRDRLYQFRLRRLGTRRRALNDPETLDYDTLRQRLDDYDGRRQELQRTEQELGERYPSSSFERVHQGALRRFAEEQERQEREAHAAREEQERREQEASRLWAEFAQARGIQPPPEGERSLVDNDRLHRQMMRLAREPDAITYERQDVLGNPHQTFGVEIEFDGGDQAEIARRLYQEGLVDRPHQVGYHASQRGRSGRWSFERDASVTGGEIVSPVLRDSPETWRQLERVCEVVRECGGRASARTGGHVHIGADESDLDHRIERLRRVALNVAAHEDLVYRLGSATGRGGRAHRGSVGGYAYCRPMRSTSQDIARTQAVGELARMVGEGHGVGLNYRNLVSGARTIEFRHFDGSLDPARIQTNIKLAAALARSGTASGPEPTESSPLGQHQQGNGGERDGALRRLAERVFARPADVLRVYAQYRRGRWQRSAPPSYGY